MAATSHGTMIFQMVPIKERSNFKIYTNEIDVADLAAWLTDWGNLKTSTQAITLGVLAQERVAIYDTFISGAIPTDMFARRENKLLIRYTGDTAGTKHRVELPAPDNSVLTFETGDGNFVVLADAGVMAAFVADFETLARSPLDGDENVTIQSIQYVGRNL